MSDAFDINERLIRLYGRDSVYNQPNYRVIWSQHLTEKRDGAYEDVTPAGIYLGTKTGIRECVKYDYLPPCWILEKFHPVFTRGVHDEVREPYTYEPLYPFLDRNNQRLPLVWMPIEFIINTYNNAEKNYAAINNQFTELEEKKLVNEQSKMRDVLEEEDPKEKPTFESSVYVGENKL